MIKEIKTIFIITVFGATVLTGCSNSSFNEQKISALEIENKSLKEQIEDLKKISPKENVTPSPSSTSNQKESQVDNKKIIEENKTVTVTDVGDITIKKTTFTTKIEPQKPEGRIIKPEISDQSNIYLDTVINLKSLLTDLHIVGRMVNVKIIYDGKYNYTTNGVVESSNGTNLEFATQSIIEPLHSAVAHFYAELPKEAATDGKSIQIVVTSNEQEFYYNLR
ncbi:hypothetical protein [Paenibacillus alba]|uniref:Lipoprotein n=1 Tax=Paenibacillus alba TaxID=1197127 RepID=A0ABU6G4E7_9BACL|nr:hypothetical protein [Paenibacillus alba]MEC0229043.1 hypothetical protein [Paenibacillus alba]